MKLHPANWPKWLQAGAATVPALLLMGGLVVKMVRFNDAILADQDDGNKRQMRLINLESRAELLENDNKDFRRQMGYQRDLLCWLIRLDAKERHLMVPPPCDKGGAP